MAHKNVSHLQKTQKADQRQASSGDLERLAVDLAAVLANPACPEILFNGVTDSLNEIQTGADTPIPIFLAGLFQAPKRKGRAA